jgi:hypothetical protein
MLSKKLQTKLALCLAAMIALQVWALNGATQAIPQGFPDFSVFYTAGRIVAAGNGTRLYDESLQDSVQRSFAPQAVLARGTLPYIHPPFEALPFVPLAHLSYLQAYAVWMIINVALIVSIPFLLRPHLHALGRLPLFLWLLALFAFYPVYRTLIQGQDSILLLFLYCLAYSSLAGGAKVASGIFLAPGMFKYHLVAPFAFLLWRKKKFIAAFVSTGVALGLVSLVITGWKGLLQYPKYVWASEHELRFVSLSRPGLMVNLRGLMSGLVPAANPTVGLALNLTLSVIVFLIMMWASSKTEWADSRQRQGMVALGQVGTVLLSYYIFPHDLSLLFLALALTLNVLLSKPAVAPGTKAVLFSCVAILFFSPLYLILSLLYIQLRLLAIVLIILFVGLLGLMRSLWDEPGASAAPAESASRETQS